MSWDYRLAHQAVKNLKRFPRKDQERIVAALEEMKVNPFGGDLTFGSESARETLFHLRRANQMKKCYVA